MNIRCTTYAEKLCTLCYAPPLPCAPVVSGFAWGTRSSPEGCAYDSASIQRLHMAWLRCIPLGGQPLRRVAWAESGRSQAPTAVRCPASARPGGGPGAGARGPQLRQSGEARHAAECAAGPRKRRADLVGQATQAMVRTGTIVARPMRCLLSALYLPSSLGPQLNAWAAKRYVRHHKPLGKRTLPGRPVVATWS